MAEMAETAEMAEMVGRWAGGLVGGRVAFVAIPPTPPVAAAAVNQWLKAEMVGR